MRIQRIFFFIIQFKKFSFFPFIFLLHCLYLNIWVDDDLFYASFWVFIYSWEFLCLHVYDQGWVMLKICKRKAIFNKIDQMIFFERQKMLKNLWFLFFNNPAFYNDNFK